MKSKQNSIEWLFKQLTDTWYDVASSKDILEKARAMHEEEQKYLIISTYVAIKMASNKLPYGMQYLTKLDKVTGKAEQFYNKHKI